MYLSKQDQFTVAAGAKPLEDIETLEQIPDAALMAAFQLYKKGSVDKDLLVNTSLRGLMSRQELVAAKRGEISDQMDIIAYIDGVIDLVHDLEQKELRWQQDKEKFPSSILNVAKAIREGGEIKHSQILGDAFFDESGRPTIGIDKLTKIRSGEIDLNDPDYARLLDRIDDARAELREEAKRQEFLTRAEQAYGALTQWEDNQAAQKRSRLDVLKEQGMQHYIELAQMVAKFEETTKVAFVTGPDAEKNQATFVKGITAAVGLSVSLNSIASVAPVPAAPVAVTAGATYDLKQAPEPEKCNETSPIFYDGQTYNFTITDPSLCKELIALSPERGKTVQVNDLISLRANQDGTYYFKVQADQKRAECLTNTSRKLRHEWANSSSLNGKDCNAISIRDNTITARNFNAIMEAAMYSAGKDGQSTLLPFLLSKWFLESRHGNLGSNPDSSARGMNQFIRVTWTEQVLKVGADLDHQELREKLFEIGESMGMDRAELLNSGGKIRKLSRNPEVKALHAQYTADPHHSALFGAAYSIGGLMMLKKGFQSGEIKHPYGAGHTEVTAKMGYICHLLGYGGCRKFFAAYAENPDQKVSDVIKGQAYRINKYLFESKAYKTDDNGEFIRNKKGDRIKRETVKMTMREFTKYMEVFGFDDKPMTSLDNYHKIRENAARVADRPGDTTFLTNKEAAGYDFVGDPNSRVAIEIPGHSLRFRQILEGVRAVPKVPETQVASVRSAPAPAI